ncbi:MAG: hypothetical protein EWM72_02412 [Nitrospira sp.]|nr:MAG: hypothetical protein EWM72_02412 [Nitrospira sp.]
MSAVPLGDVPNAWRHFLIDLMFARNYTIGYLNHPGPVAKNPVVERLLPSLLQVKAVAILDHALRAWIDNKGLFVPKKPYGTDLKGRIDYLANNGHLADRFPLHSIRGTRNALAHEPAGAVDWAELDRDVTAIQSALSELKMVKEMPQWEIFSERSAAQAGEIPKSICTFHYLIGIRQGSKMVAEIKWAQHVMADDA